MLDHISPMFSVEKTVYGGRGGFAARDIPKGTIVAECQGPLSSTIVREFKKEVCNHCFLYDHEKNMKTRFSDRKNAVLYFCSNACLESFKLSDKENVFVDSMMKIEELFNRMLKKPEIEYPEPNFTSLEPFIEEQWAQVRQWEKLIANVKPSKRDHFIPRLSDSEYLDAKYVVGILFQHYKYHLSELEQGYLSELDSDRYYHAELEIFNSLQSNESDKIQRYPYLLYSYINTYKFLKLTSDPKLQPYLTTESFRNIIGRHLSNAFGIWSQVQSEREDKEFFGYGVYPSASFFNHSCSPNMVKKRVDRAMVFEALKDIKAGDELCINYGYSTEERVEVRRQDLKEWFFECQCTRCVEEGGQV